ncbi:MarR family transcriptional regulator [Paenibacillus filicis]|uniref:MarR family transcriptional regulator n=1 Tax=Paenibacillus gyeongsangnamensis TaxID=3388067 RepID=A0ABT4QKL8_9BACL|nr:MarR family transcriptional regulator [Paenibacillus filicis]MCZ8517408.1 MarR family transcriptional regulator [Paenibacillus filicis]
MSPTRAEIERFEKAFFLLFRRIGPGLGLPPELPITGQQIMMLYQIVSLKPCTVTMLAHKLDVKPSAITVMIDRLVQHGYVSRTHDEKDRRVVLLELTEEGVAVLQRVRKIRTDTLEGYMSRLEPEEWDSFLRIFEKLVQDIED